MVELAFINTYVHITWTNKSTCMIALLVEYPKIGRKHYI